jgi:hypothetical protein
VDGSIGQVHHANLRVTLTDAVVATDSLLDLHGIPRKVVVTRNPQNWKLRPSAAASLFLLATVVYLGIEHAYRAGVFGKIA